MAGDHVEVEGVVADEPAGGHFLIQIDGGGTVRAQLGGKLRKNRIRVLVGDRVKVALSPYDLSHGLITYRSRS